jgi:hypothetical protein
MKIARLFTSLFAVTLCLAALTSASFAKTNPLNSPIGLAVDASGNLYVANQNTNQILVFNSAYAQQTGKTITNGIAEPTGVAIDAYGNLWVANYSNNSITEYTGGVLQSANTITNEISGPQNIAFDEIGDLWVNNNENDLTMYAPTSAGAPPSVLVQKITMSGIFAVGEAAGALYTGYDTGTCVGSTSAILRGGASLCDLGGYPTGGSAFAADNKGGEYEAATYSGNAVFYNAPGGVSYTFFVGLPFTPSFNECGMAVDNVKDRLYVSNRAGDEILVYSTASKNSGALIKTIQ